MAATTGSFFATQQDRIEEIISSNIHFFLPGLDPIFRDTISTSIGVLPANELGRDLKILRVYTGGLAGVIEEAAPRDNFILYGDDQNTTLGAKLGLMGIDNVWPDPRKGPNAKPYRLGIGLNGKLTNLMLTLGEMRAEATPAFIGQYIAPKMKAFARNVALAYCNAFYLDQAEFYKLSSASAPSAVTTSSGLHTWTFEPTNLAVNRFHVGMRVDYFDSTGTTLQNAVSAARVDVYVVAVDPLLNKVTLAGRHATAPSGWDGGAMVAGDIVVYANSGDATVFTNVAGIHSWLKGGSGGNDNFLLGAERDTSNAIDVTVHPEFKSFTKAVNGPLTEARLRLYDDAWQRAKSQYGQTIDTFIASGGVWRAYEEQKISREWIDRTNRLSSLNSEGSEGAYGEFKFTVNGRTVQGYTSNYVKNETVYGIRKNNNWKRVVPPSPKGFRNDPGSEGGVPFSFIAGAITGLATNQLPIYKTDATINQVTEGVQLPGEVRMQLVPWEQPSGMLLTAVTESRVLSDN